MNLKPAPDCLPQAMDYLDTFLASTPCGPRSRIALETVLEEVLMNIVHHSGATDADFDAAYVGDEIILRFSDDGVPFNPLAQAEPDVTLPAAERSVGGLGILMVRRMTDRQTYAYEHGRNVLTLAKRIP